MFKTTIMVNKRKKNLLYNFYFRQTAVFFLSLFNFNPSILLFSSFSFLYLFRFNFVKSQRNVHFLFLPTYPGGTFSPLLDISERNFFPRWGDARAPPPPAYAPAADIGFIP